MGLALRRREVPVEETQVKTKTEQKPVQAKPEEKSKMLYFFASGEKALAEDGSGFTKDKSKWMKFTEEQREHYTKFSKKPPGATTFKSGKFVPVT